METKKRDFIIKYFGCYTTIDDNQVLTSLANASRVPVEEFWKVKQVPVPAFHVRGQS